MGKQYTPIDLIKAFGKQNYLILDNRYKQQLANQALVKDLWTIGHFFVVMANTNEWKTELACGECEEVSGYSAAEIETLHAGFMFKFPLPEDTDFNMVTSKLAMQYFNTRPIYIKERELIFVFYFYRARRKDGKVITVQHQAIPLMYRSASRALPLPNGQY